MWFRRIPLYQKQPDVLLFLSEAPKRKRDGFIPRLAALRFSVLRCGNRGKSLGTASQHHYIPQEREETDVLFVLLTERYERRSFVLTSNLPFSKWDSVFKDPITAMAAVDRLVHHSMILELNGESFRASAASKKKAAIKQEEKVKKNAILIVVRLQFNLTPIIVNQLAKVCQIISKNPPK